MAAEQRTESETNDRDVADLLYQNGVGVPVLTFIAGVFMVAAMPSVHAKSPVAVAVWLGAHALIAVLRGIDIAGFAKRRLVPNWSGRREILRFGAGTFTTAITWAAFPLLFFHELSPIERLTMAAVLCVLAGGSAPILGASPALGIAFASGMLLPTTALYLLTPEPGNMILGIGGLFFYAFMVLSTSITRRGTMSAIAMARANQRLMREMVVERERGEQANRALTEAQVALRESLENLEERIKARTADLEHEMRERERYGAELARLAMHDSLTGLYNRTTLTRKLSEEIAEAAVARMSVAVLFLDLDKFKDVNDLHGHHAGDIVLRAIVERMASILRRDAILARWGGDEFVFVQRITRDVGAATAVAERLRRSVSAPIDIGGESVNVGATIGIALYPEHGQTPDELIRAADMAMYAAKQRGRGGIQTFDHSLADALGRRHQLDAALRDAIDSGALRLEFQPVIDAQTRQCTALEALLRWDSPAYGPIPPSEFIPNAERTGDINAIGRWVLDRACAEASRWPGDMPPAVSVNVSVAQIASGLLLDDVRGALARSGLDPQRLQIEVTETLFASDNALTIPTLEALRAMGIRILLDDFGTGFSSLSYLGSLPIDAIKIDKSFIGGVDGRSRAIVDAIQSLAGAFNLAVVAEGVETAEQAQLLLSMGVPAFQGYFFSRPMRAEVVSDAIRSFSEARRFEAASAFSP